MHYNVLQMLRDFMTEQKVDFLLVNSTNQFLVEYNTLAENSRYHLTGFSGSTGDALVSRENVFLFVDGRYHIQADLEVDHSLTTVVKLQTGQKFLDEMLKKIPQDAVLGLFSRKNSQSTVDFIQKQRKIKLISDDPLDVIDASGSSEIVPVDKSLTGLSADEKIAKIKLNDNEAILLTNLEEVSYLFNLRDFSMPFSAKIKAKAVILKDKAVLFEADRLDKFEEFIKALDKKIYVDKSSINAYDYALLGDRAADLTSNPVKLMKSIKTDAEIAHYKDAFRRTDNAVRAVREYINSHDNISEFDIARKLEEEFIKNGAKGLSFNSIVAKDKNSALAHYSKSSPDEVLKDGSLVLIDCGAYFDGGLATDITRVFVKGEPDELQKKVYTTVLKAFLHAYNTEIKEGMTGYDIDAEARVFFDENPVDGFVFNHGLGHGIGINVHEAPPNLGKGDIAKTPLRDNMCFTIEPGLYNAEHFGVRLENSCYLENGKIKSFVKMPYENKLIDYTLLTNIEKEWLEEFGGI